MDINFLNIFQGLATLADSEPKIMIGRIFLMCLGVLLIYLGKKGILEALLMIPMGLGMATVNAAVLFLDDGRKGTLFLDPLINNTEQLMTMLQIDWLQPIYTFTFSNGLIACLVFMGIGVLLDVGFVMARPFTSMFIALCAEIGTVITLPLAVWMGLSVSDAAATATIGGADGPMILFTALILSKELFVPITVVAYLYLGLTYGGYPWLIKLMVPRHIRGMKMPVEKTREISSTEKLVFAVIANVILCLLFPVAAPLFFSRLMAFPADTRFDICLFWDIFNYLRRDEITAFIDTLRPFLHTRTLAHGFALHNVRTPQHDAAYGISAPDTLSVRQRDTRLPGYSPHPQSRLKSLLRCFHFDRCVLLADSRLELLLSARL